MGIPFGIGTGIFIPAMAESIAMGAPVEAGRRTLPLVFAPDVSGLPGIPLIPGIGGIGDGFRGGVDCAAARAAVPTSTASIHGR